MKKLLAGILCVVMVFSIVACGKSAVDTTTSADAQGESIDEVEKEDNTVKKEDNTVDNNESEGIEEGLIPIRIYSYYDSASENANGASWEVARVGGDLASKYQKLDEALNAKNDQMIKESEEFKKNISGLDNDESQRFTHKSNAYVMRSDTSVVSVLYITEDYSGGAHGYTEYEPVNYIPVSSEKITLSNLVTNLETFKSLLDTKLKSEYSDVYADLMSMDDYFKDANDENFYFSFDNCGVTVYFNSYVLGAYALGRQIVTIPYTDLQGVIDEKYMPVSKSYITPIYGDENTVNVDADGDGKVESYLIEETFPEEYSVGWKITGRGKTVEINNYCYEGNNYLVCDNGNYYLYFFELSENDWTNLSVVNLKDMSYDSSKNMDFNSAGVYIDNENDSFLTGYRDEIIDPENMCLYYRTDVLGTNTAHARYKIGEDGYPVMLDSAYTSDTSRALKLIVDLEVDELGEDGSVTGKTTLKSGTFVTIAYTDDKSYADIVVVDEANLHKMDGTDSFTIYLLNDEVATYTADATLYRVSYNKEDYPHTVNGVDEDKVFDFVMYSG